MPILANKSESWLPCKTSMADKAFFDKVEVFKLLVKDVENIT